MKNMKKVGTGFREGNPGPLARRPVLFFFPAPLPPKNRGHFRVNWDQFDPEMASVLGWKRGCGHSKDTKIGLVHKVLISLVGPGRGIATEGTCP